MKENLWYLFFCNCLNYFNMVISGCVHFPANNITSFSLITEEFTLCICIPLLIHYQILNTCVGSIITGGF